MILFTILAIILVLLGVVAIAVLAVGGTIGVIIFGDVIVCIVIIVLLMKWLLKK